MNVCFFGLGSIGQRHLRNLRAVCRERGIELVVDALRRTETPLPEDVSRVVRVLSDPARLSTCYDAVFITNPTHLHHQTLCENANRTNRFFVEKPLFERLRALPPVESRDIYVACPLRYSGVIDRLPSLLEHERVCSAVATCSSYLPLWRKADYRQTYSAHKNAGGGVSVDLIHEIDYICHLFGKPSRAHMEAGKYSGLEIDSEDAAAYQLVYPDKLVLVYLDYFGVSAQRDLVVRTEKAVVRADFLRPEVTIERLDGTKETLRWDEDPNDKYLREMERFLDWIGGKAYNQNDAGLASAILAVATGETA